MIDLKGETSVSVNTKKYGFNIPQIGYTEFLYHTDTVKKFIWDSLKIAVSKKTFKKINQQKWMIAYNTQDKIIKVMDYKPKYAETGWHQPIVYPKKDNILFIDSWQNKFVSNDTFILGCNVEQTVNIRISLDKSRKNQIDSFKKKFLGIDRKDYFNSAIDFITPRSNLNYKMDYLDKSV